MKVMYHGAKYMVIVNKRHALHKQEFHLMGNLASGQLVDYVRNGA
jgi:hypothetical protein